MTNFPRFLAGAAAVGAFAAPAAAQYQYPQQQYQQQYQYPQQYQQTYPQQGYGYNQGYNQNPIGQIIDQLLGNRYSVSDRQAVSQCASAAIRQSAAQYGGNGYNQGYNQGHNGYAQNQGYGYNRYRVTAITDVQRRSNGLRVSGTLSSGGGYRGNGYNQGYGNRGDGAGNLSFRCNVDYRGYVTNVRIRPIMYRQGY